MASIHISGNYSDNLKKAQSTQIKRIVKPPPGSQSAPTVISYTIPPLNTNINLSALPKYEQQKHIGVRALRTMQQLPETFDWKNIYDTDSDEMKRKKALISDVPNQALCGSCWAVAGATVISDNFVVSGLVKYKPLISETYALSCYPQAQCGGGNPAEMFIDIEKNGIGDMRCIDYSWCLKNEGCNGAPTKHFGTEGLNDIIPSCGCYKFSEDQLLYNISNPQRISMEDKEPSSFALLVKNHIYSKGSVIGTYLVFSNFFGGKFDKTGGVYLENFDYENNRYVRRGSVAGEYKGSHAVSIIGWGVSKQLVVDSNGTKEDVPYWYVRNSWKNTWGDNGYFKMAMYPYNKMSQFDKEVIITDDNNNSFLGGGIILMTAENIKKKSPVVTNNYKGEYIKDSNFYIDPPKDVVFNGVEPVDPNKPIVEVKKEWSTVQILWIIGMCITVIIVLYLLYKIYYEYKELSSPDNK